MSTLTYDETHENLVVDTFYVDSKYEEIDKIAFYRLHNLKKIVFGEDCNINKIGENAFMECENLESIDLENTKITELPINAFRDCKKLKQIKLPETLQRIGESAFENCKLLKEINFVDSLEEIGEFAINGCDSIKRITINSKFFYKTTKDENGNSDTKYFKNIVTGCKELEEIEFILDNDTTDIPEYFCVNCSKLKTINSNGKKFGCWETSFYRCENLALPKEARLYKLGGRKKVNE